MGAADAAPTAAELTCEAALGSSLGPSAGDRGPRAGRRYPSCSRRRRSISRGLRPFVSCHRVKECSLHHVRKEPYSPLRIRIRWNAEMHDVVAHPPYLIEGI